ncbi:cytochrome P450 [Laetiporus sulphureus 93-53]|uniref:Cytochrome P450 n=1 Tax=Laetiporus sulphureus 93-53 TaxID=1314785 RepID=A0A165DFT9_9APHY|nr:cytochrome P450 [Laetiporus sulphureus 93-53]KZT04799.1 cytochrome P450 [Laetiporus sulphureus 93-53]
MISLDVIVLFLFIVLVTVVYFLKHDLGTPRRLPPGPRRLPLVGNIFQFDPLRSYLKFHEWALKYGEVVYLRLGSQDVIVLNTAQAANELLANRSGKYSSRAPPHVAFDLMSDGQRMVFLPYDKEWKTVRRSVQGVLGINQVKRYRRLQDLESRSLIHDLLMHGNQSVVEDHRHGPNDEVPERHWFAIVRRYTTSLVLQISYGRRVPRLYNNPDLHKIYDVMDNFTRVSQPGRYLADAFPILRALPDLVAPWRAEGRRMHAWEMKLWGGYFEESRAAARKGTIRHGFINDYLRARSDAGHEHAPGNGLTDDGWMRDKMITYTGGSLLEAGSDTTAATIQTFILLMLSHPHCLRCACEEIDEVVGSDRMPEWEDEEQLPYLVACIKESIRRRPVIITGVPHKAEEDDVYQGYHIPKGATVIGNIWAIHMDPQRWPNPTAFDPDRFYMKGQPTQWAGGPDSKNRDHFVFGWGRRFCQGSHLAEASLFITLSRLLWGIDISAPLDPETKQPLLPDIADDNNWTEGFVTGPRMFKVNFMPRSEKHARITRKYYEEAQSEWQMMGLPMDER